MDTTNLSPAGKQAIKHGATSKDGIGEFLKNAHSRTLALLVAASGMTASLTEGYAANSVPKSKPIPSALLTNPTPNTDTTEINEISGSLSGIVGNTLLTTKAGVNSGIVTLSEGGTFTFDQPRIFFSGTSGTTAEPTEQISRSIQAIIPPTPSGTTLLAKDYAGYVYCDSGRPNTTTDMDATYKFRFIPNGFTGDTNSLWQNFGFIDGTPHTENTGNVYFDTPDNLLLNQSSLHFPGLFVGSAGGVFEFGVSADITNPGSGNFIFFGGSDTDDTIPVTLNHAPEPTTIFFSGAGLLVILARRRRHSQS